MTYFDSHTLEIACLPCCCAGAVRYLSSSPMCNNFTVFQYAGNQSVARVFESLFRKKLGGEELFYSGVPTTINLCEQSNVSQIGFTFCNYSGTIIIDNQVFTKYTHKKKSPKIA